jgi:hypothetical protein
MTVADLEVLYDYGYWANRHLCQVLSPLPPSDFTAPAACGGLRPNRPQKLSGLGSIAGDLRGSVSSAEAR